MFNEPTPLGLALEYVNELRRSPATVEIAAGDRHWGIFVDLCEAVGAKGNLVPDAYLAALALEQGASWVTADRGFARFPGLRVLHP